MGNWTTTWAQAHADMSVFCKKIKDHTVRLTVVSQADGTRLRLRLSNQEGPSDTNVVGASIQIGGLEPVAVTFAGKRELTLGHGDIAVSDPAEVAVRIGDTITISLAFRGTAVSGNILPEAVRYSTKGDYTGCRQMPAARMSIVSKLFGVDPVMPILAAVELFSEQESDLLVCFGDSLTQMSRWTAPLAERLRYAGRRIAVVNKGIGGNRLLAGPVAENMPLYGIAGLRRFQADVLDVSGATAVLIAIGVNDLNGAKDAAEAGGMAEALMKAYRNMAAQARQLGMKVYLATVTPSRGCKGYQPLCEKERCRLNEMLRSCTEFDGIVDFDAVIRDPEEPDRMRESCDSGDHIHPGVIGGRMMADAAYALFF